MATSASLNVWLDELSTSILSRHRQRKPNTKKLQDAFRRRVKKHNFARTNQFEVENRLDGLEEKFQILDLDSLSDALRQRRIELKIFENHWLPDVLDLFLSLSGNPAANQTLLELYRIPPRVGTPPPLKWKDLLADSPINRNDGLWKVPDFRDADDSGYDDDFSSSIGTTTSSLKLNRQQSLGQAEIGVSKNVLSLNPDIGNVSTSLLNYRQVKPREISEVHFIRESLFLLRGYSTNILVYSDKLLSIIPQTEVLDISRNTLEYVTGVLWKIRHSLDRVVSWISMHAEEPYMAAMKHAAEGVIHEFYESIDDMQQTLVEPIFATVTSLSSTINQIDLTAANLNTLAHLLNSVAREDSISCLETLYDSVQTSQLCADSSRFRCLLSLLIPALIMYLKPVIQWIGTGTTTRESLPPFIEATTSKVNLRKIWNEQFSITAIVHQRPPGFLTDTVVQILACGKTSAFLNQLRNRLRIPCIDATSINQFEVPVTGDILIPFAQVFEQTWSHFVEDFLHRRTIELKETLSTYCNFRQTLDSIQRLYFPRNGLLMHNIEVILFDRVDRCIDSWNDRFQLKDMLEDAFHMSDTHAMVDSITIHSAYTSSRTMQSQRTSVKILSSLSLEYILSWPLANIINDASMTSYRRVALTLMQIRRAKYSLERIGYVSAVSVPLGHNANLADQTFAQVLAFTLLTFVNTLLDSIMLSSIWPATEAMQNEMQDASSVDEMIGTHHSYITRLECSCLAAPRLRILRQSLESILDLCIRFSDLVSNPSKIEQDGSDHEVSSFRSAKSRNKSLRLQQYGSDDEDEDDEYSRRLGDGYSSFIVLGDDTSIVKELRKVKTQYEKQTKFLISGLRGVSQGGHDMAYLDVLADRLAWLQVR